MAQAADPRLTETRLDLAEGLGPALHPAVAAQTPSRLAVAWATVTPNGADLHLRRRINFLWDPSAIRLAGPTGADPRDLTLAFDERLRLHLLWTAIEAGARRLFHAAVADDGTVISQKALNPDDPADADFPQVRVAWNRGLFVVWQSARRTLLSVQAGRIDAERFELDPLPSVSPTHRSAMGPQILRLYPPTVSWFEAREQANVLRVSVFDELTQQWAPTRVAGLEGLFPEAYRPALLFPDRGTPIACWNDEGPDGQSSIRLARRPLSDPDTLEFEHLGDPVGEHRRPQALALGPDVLTLVWQVFAEGRQFIRAAQILWQVRPPSPLTVSPSSHRFPAEPAHAGGGYLVGHRLDG